MFFFSMLIENMALGRPTWQQHPFCRGDCGVGSENAVDGFILTVYHSQISVLYHTIADTRLNGKWILVVWSASATLIFSTGLTTYQA